MKTIKNRFQVSFRYPLTRIIYLYYQRLIFYPDRNINRTFLFRVLECIRHQIAYNLFQTGYIRIPINRFINITEGKIDPVLLRNRYKRFALLPDQTAYGHPFDLYMTESDLFLISKISWINSFRFVTFSPRIRAYFSNFPSANRSADILI